MDTSNPVLAEVIEQHKHEIMAQIRAEYDARAKKAARAKRIRDNIRANPQRPKGRNRNALCYCGSGEKYKNCHLRQDRQTIRNMRVKA